MVNLQQPERQLQERAGELRRAVTAAGRLPPALGPATTRHAHAIGIENLRESGNADTALAGYYDDCVTAIAPDIPTQRSLREWFGDHLITSGGIRGQVLREQAASGGLDNTLVDKLVDTHLVRGEQRAGATWYELAHDRLIQPILTSNTTWFEHNLQPMQQQAALWEQQEEDPTASSSAATPSKTQNTSPTATTPPCSPSSTTSSSAPRSTDCGNPNKTRNTRTRHRLPMHW